MSSFYIEEENTYAPAVLAPPNTVLDRLNSGYFHKEFAQLVDDQKLHFEIGDPEPDIVSYQRVATLPRLLLLNRESSLRSWAFTAYHAIQLLLEDGAEKIPDAFSMRIAGFSISRMSSADLEVVVSSLADRTGIDGTHLIASGEPADVSVPEQYKAFLIHPTYILLQKSGGPGQTRTDDLLGVNETL